MAYWTSPELLVPEQFGLKESRPTKASDCYALGMMVYEVLSGQIPFDQHPPVIVVFRILEGERPERPQGAQGAPFTDDIWAILELCWKHEPSDRIGAKAVLWGLEGNSPLSESSFNVGGGVDDQSVVAAGEPRYVLSVLTRAHLQRYIPCVGLLIGLIDGGYAAFCESPPDGILIDCSKE